MLFTSPVFLFVFFPVFFMSFFLIKDKYKNYLILLFSFAFYFWSEPKFVFVIVASLFADYYLVKLIDRHRERKNLSRLFLAIAVVVNVGVLVYFKYMNFFVDNLNAILGSLHLQPISWITILLPIGVSFIVFEKITYIVDVYKGLGHPARDMQTYSLYILLFPKLLAGPIVKYHDIESQLNDRRTDIDAVLYGIFRFSLGLAKKTIIADNLATYSDRIFAMNAHDVNSLNTWMGVLCFTLQIFFDFSAYSDMAIGMARMMGFKLNENFNKPYIALNFTDFWRRWHISLSTWIRNYLYIPLGGNRVSTGRMYFNLCFCFFISGLWHGANWTFIIWGIYHGLFLAIDKIFWIKLSARLPRLVNVVLTFLFVIIGWVFFRATSFEQAITLLGNMFNVLQLKTAPSAQILELGNSQVFYIIVGLLICFLPYFKRYEQVVNALNGLALKRRNLLYVGFSVLFVLLSMTMIATSNFNPFLYFRF